MFDRLKIGIATNAPMRPSEKYVLKPFSKENKKIVSKVIENAQSGINYPGRKTFGHSLIVSPDGEILNELEVNEGIISSKIDPLLTYKLRQILIVIHWGGGHISDNQL